MTVMAQPVDPAEQGPADDLRMTAGSALTFFLASARLQQYEAALRDLGCAMPADLHELEDDDFEAVGIKTIEQKRLKRLLTEQ